MSRKILFLEDDVRLRRALASDFRDKGYEVFEADLLENVPKVAFDFAVVDLRLAGENGLNSIPVLRELNPLCSIVILTGYGSVASTVEAMKLGALNYLIKPIDSDMLEDILLGKPVVAPLDKKENEEALLSLSQHEHEYIDFVLMQNKGNITKTAKDLGLHRQSLQRKLKKKP